MFGLGYGEILLVILLILLLFGARKIPEVMSGLGKGLREFKKATSEATTEIKRAIDEPAPPTDEVPKDGPA